MKNASNDPAFNRFVTAAANRMSAQTAASGRKSWREAAQESMQGKVIREVLKSEMKGATGVAVTDIVQRNAELIRSVPLNIASELSNMALELSQKGLRPQVILKEMRQKAPKLTSNRLMTIARTESSKAASALDEARCEALRIDWYIWRTAQDGDRVRKSHRKMDGVLVNWKDPPSPEALVGQKSTLGKYHAGCCPNCRCYDEPVLNFDDLPGRIKVYRGGRIQSLSRTAFIRESTP